ncbi:hypothetical protein AAFF_G00004120 [Aldrovandia affinis]|uniref:Uncharacterized protein n=1 Tax=Aldrovandia affinis TaxID=143900 RepID=A0AAD7TDS8_9TELE|nr:hypothetical protein AAFF_G00004120 [Aldrovandia affinis]
MVLTSRRPIFLAYHTEASMSRGLAWSVRPLNGSLPLCRVGVWSLGAVLRGGWESGQTERGGSVARPPLSGPGAHILLSFQRLASAGRVVKNTGDDPC